MEVFLLMPLNGADIIEDKQLENKEKRMNYRSCTVYLKHVRNVFRLAGRFEEQKTKNKIKNELTFANPNPDKLELFTCKVCGKVFRHARQTATVIAQKSAD